MPRLVVVVLAAGASERLGEPKGLARLGPRAHDTPVALLVAAARTVTEEVLVVVGRHRAALERHAAELSPPVPCLANPSWREGRTGGLALAAAQHADADLLVAPVDVPLVGAEVFEALAAAWRAAGAPPRGWLAPRHEGRHGHPVLVGRRLAEELGRWPAARPLRGLRALADPLLSVAVASPRVLDDLDRPEDLARLRALVAGT